MSQRPVLTLAPRPSSAQAVQAFRHEILDAEQMFGHVEAWHGLCARAAEPNVYYTPHFARALLDTVERGTTVRFATAWDGADLVGLLPVVAPRWPLLPNRGWQSLYTYSGTPLLDEQRALPAANTLLDALTGLPRTEWLLPTLNTDGPAHAALTAALALRDAPWCHRAAFQRAALERSGTFDAHMETVVGKKRAKDVARNRRRLEQTGALEHRVCLEGGDLKAAVEAFLSIEASGWKGRAGTALACKPDTAAFARAVFTTGGGHRCRADVLALDGRPIAVGLIVFAGEVGFTVKGAYDESLRSFGPGLLLEIEVIKAFFEGDWASRLDGATAGEHVVDGLWNGRIAVADLAFSLAPAEAATRLDRMTARLDALAAAKAQAKALLGRIKALRGGHS